MALEKVMRVDNGNIIGAGGGGENSVEIDWADWILLTPEEQETGDWTIVNCPWADGNVSVDLMTKLWENPNPTSSFAAQTVAVDLSGYDLILTLTNGGISAITTNIIGKSVYLNEAVAAASIEVITRRRLGVINNNGITFYDAYRAGHSASGTVDNTLLVPYQIYGIKLTATVKINAIAMDVSTSADKCMLSENESVKDRINPHEIGTLVNISSYTDKNQYTCPSDGYVRLSISGNGKGQMVIGGYVLAGTESTVSFMAWSLFVRKGTKTYMRTGTNATLMFFPMIESV